jgi:glycosyltransferase involved in cell wall biosynthesis
VRTGVFIPAFNAAATLPRVVERIPAELSGTIHRIWIVNDGSTDATSAVARELGRSWPNVSVVDLPRNLGYGGAVKRGLAECIAAGVDAAVCLHADGQYAPEELPGLLSQLEDDGLDLLQGSRIASGTALSGGMPLYKYLANRALTALENRVLDLCMTDYHSGYLLYGRRALARIPFARLSDSFDFDLEVIACARATGLRVGERPIPTHYGEEISHLNPVTYGLRALWVMFNYLHGRYHRLGVPDRTAKG